MDFSCRYFFLLGSSGLNCTRQRDDQAEGNKTKILMLGINVTSSTFGTPRHKESFHGQNENELSLVEILRAKIGRGPDDIGAVTPEEGNPEGPMSFVVNCAGEIYILDQVNSRIQVFKDGQRIKTISIPGEAFIDIEWMPSRRVALLDNLVKKSLYVLNEDGSVYETIPLTGSNMPDPAEIIGMGCHADGVWAGLCLYLSHDIVRIADLEGNPQPFLASLPRKLSNDGKRLMKAELSGERTAIIHISQEDFNIWHNFQVNFDMPFGYIYGVWDNSQGTIYLEAYLLDEKTPTEANVAVKLSPHGKELGWIKMFVSPMPHEIYHPVWVMPDGTIYQLAMEEEA